MPEPEQLSRDQALLSTRRALLADPLSLQVHAWLRRIYVHPPKHLPVEVAKTTLPQMIGVVEQQIKKEAKFGTALERVSAFISSPIAPEYLKAFETVKRSKSSLLGTFISVVYGRALLLLVESRKESGAMVNELKDYVAGTSTFIDKYQETQGMLDRNFVGHLVTTAEIEAQLDPYFDNALQRSGALFVEAHRPAHERRNPFAEAGAAMQVLNEHPAAWWRLPASVAFAMTVWHQAA